ncbi:hypothetical protein [Bordetella pseudohinzii]|uniref:hypothetical protein n=1 Tax=Bordetella pseudohinzii TaxID=1331258 RepID=UPI00045B5C96|nr:hypothetical protein [Bordetella pseudohinzii]
MTLEFPEQSIAHVEGLLAGWNDASIRSATPLPDHYRDQPEQANNWNKAYRAGREAFLTAWEKGALSGARFQMFSHGDARHWRVPMVRYPERPVAYLVDATGHVVLTLAPLVKNSAYGIFSGEMRVAVVTGDLLSAMQAAACYAH